MITVLVNVKVIKIHEEKIIHSKDDFFYLIFTTSLVFEVNKLN